MAGATFAVIPTIILFTFTQKYFVQGIATSGIKG
jgi:multiple sugar transport system permease protein